MNVSNIRFEHSTSSELSHSHEKLVSSLVLNELISSVLLHKKVFKELIDEIEESRVYISSHDDVTLMIANYLNLDHLRFKENSKKIKKEKDIRLHLSPIRANIFALAYYEHVTCSCYGDPYGFFRPLYSFANSQLVESSILIRIFKLYNIDLKNKLIRSNMVRPDYYMTHSSSTSNIHVYTSFRSDLYIERWYDSKSIREILFGNFGKINYSRSFYYKMKDLGVDFSHSSDIGSSKDIIHKVLYYLKIVTKDIFEFLELVLSNERIRYDSEWIDRLADMYSRQAFNEKEDKNNSDFAIYSDRLLMLISQKYGDQMNRVFDISPDIEYIAAPILKVLDITKLFGRRNFTNFVDSFTKLLSSRKKSLSNKEFNVVRQLMFLEQLVRQLPNEMPDFLSEKQFCYSTEILGECKFSFGCELKKYAIRYGKENLIKALEKVRLESPGSTRYPQYKQQYLEIYSGDCTIIPVIECNWNDRNSCILEQEYESDYDDYDSDY